jgi:VacB/RNase II family 3'-5' exoribonuclease
MLLANKAVATKIKENTRSGVYRVHDLPDEKKLVEIERFVKNLGYNYRLVNSQNINKEINTLLKACEGKPEKNVIDMMIIRAMSKAKYSSQNIGHFGLKFENYSHFTSPIRRYPDLMVHRILFSILKKEKYYDKEIEEKCFHCSQREDLATKAERASTKLMQVKYMSKRINEKFAGIVSGINERGVFVEVISNKCEGFVRMKDIPHDYFVYNYKTNSLIGQNTKEEYCLGDKVSIRVEKTNLEKKHIDFKILSKSE